MTFGYIKQIKASFFYSADRYVYLESEYIEITDIWLNIVSWHLWAQFETKTSETIACVLLVLRRNICKCKILQFNFFSLGQTSEIVFVILAVL